MATQPHTTAHEPAPSTHAPPHPGGMASDPAAAIANEIVTTIKGAVDKLKFELPPDLIGNVAEAIRKHTAGEVAKAMSASQK